MISKIEAINRLRQEGYHISKNRFSTPYLKKLNFNINTLIDIGVNYGTPDLYAAFPKKKMILIDPQEIVLNNLYSWQKKKYDITIINKALGEEQGEVNFNYSDIRARSSTLIRRDTRKKKENITTSKVLMTTLDLLSKEYSFNAPFGLKLDTEGYENRILKGSKEVLQKTEFVIIEVSIKQRFEEGAKFSEIVALLAEANLELFDILTPLIKAPRVMDCLFVKNHNPLLQV